MPVLFRISDLKASIPEFAEGYWVFGFDAGTLNARNLYPTYDDAVAETNGDPSIELSPTGRAVFWVKGGTKLIFTDENADIESPLQTIDDIDVGGGTELVDAAGNYLLSFNSELNSVNNVEISNAAAGQSPAIYVVGSDTNPNLELGAKGTGSIKLTSDIDVNGKLIETSETNGNIALVPNGTGHIGLTGPVTVSSTLAVSGNVTIPVTTGSFNLIPSGVIVPWAGPTANNALMTAAGWLECNGQVISRTTYAGLFAALGTTYGAGDGSTTFALPNTERRVIIGEGGTAISGPANTVGATNALSTETHTLSTAEMPAHNHTYSAPTFASQYFSGSVSASNTFQAGVPTSSTGGNGAHNNMQPSIVMTYFIKI